MDLKVKVMEISEEMSKCIERIFFEKIKGYNERKEFFSRYIMIEKHIVEISWSSSWSYKIYPIEEIIEQIPFELRSSIRKDIRERKAFERKCRKCLISDSDWILH